MIKWFYESKRYRLEKKLDGEIFKFLQVVCKYGGSWLWYSVNKVQNEFRLLSRERRVDLDFNGSVVVEVNGGGVDFVVESYVKTSVT